MTRRDYVESNLSLYEESRKGVSYPLSKYSACIAEQKYKRLRGTDSKVTNFHDLQVEKKAQHYSKLRQFLHEHRKQSVTYPEEVIKNVDKALADLNIDISSDYFE